MHVRLGSCLRLWQCSHGPTMMSLINAFLVLLGTLHQPARCATLEELFDGGSLTVGYSRFSDWELISLDSTGAAPPEFVANRSFTPLQRLAEPRHTIYRQWSAVDVGTRFHRSGA